ncbi:hypothetical protein HXZ94_09310 [Empedobacter falsenii]|uniref:hypothetical protein n=1 Tax=Empedobacter falsenii TaxID=343874 RepID=UPI0025766653|nr:hypothetical protein [Empedobacter falsenii]MDM1298700.1 hypothetical protein [Empedobacter falsenii]MDM1318493.1 hypothetical protein [Empedobacter falsenii]
MNTNDPIEDLFRSRSNETVGEKPRDLVWKRIESGLQNEEKKKKPIREFVSSVWFSAAVFALIAIPYFVLFIENINTENRENSLEIVKTNVPVIEQSPAEQEEIVVLESKDKDLEKPLEIVKNDKVTKEPVYKVIEGHSADAIADEGYFPQLSKASAPNAPVTLSAPQAMEARSKVLDSIEKEGQYAKANNQNLGSIKDSVISDKLAGKASGVVVANGVSRQNAKLKDTSDVMKMTVVAEERTANTSLETASVMEVSPKKSVIDKSAIVYKPLKFTVKSDILRTNFKLQKKSKNKISFESTTNNLVITFEKVNDKIVLTTNEPKVDATLLGVLEKNKKEIFTYYSK